MRFVKRPVEVDAWPIADLLATDRDAWPPEVAAAFAEGGWIVRDRGLVIPTLEGPMFGGPDDWLIRGTRGEWYPCKPGPFADTFEAVQPDEVPWREAGDADPATRCHVEGCTLGPHPKGTGHTSWRGPDTGDMVNEALRRSRSTE